MIDDRQESRVGERQDFLILRYTAEGAHLGLGDVETPGIDDIAPTPPGEAALTAGDRNVESAPEMAVAVEVFRCDRFLEPGDVEVGQLASDLERFDGGVAVVGIDHEVERSLGRNTRPNRPAPRRCRFARCAPIASGGTAGSNRVHVRGRTGERDP